MVSLKDFMTYLDGYLGWYNHSRIRFCLGGMSDVEYRVLND